MVMRLPQVHDTCKQGRGTQHIQLARQQVRVAYVETAKPRSAFSSWAWLKFIDLQHMINQSYRESWIAGIHGR